MNSENPDSINLSSQTKFSPFKFGIISIIAIMIFYNVAGGILFFLLSFSSGTLFSDLRFSTLVGQLLFMLLPTLFLIKLQHGSLSKGLNLRIPKAKEVIITILIVLIFQFALEGFIYFQMKIPFPEQIQEFLNKIDKLFEDIFRQLVLAKSFEELLFVIFVIAVVPGVCEEVLFRGLLLKNISIAASQKTAIILSGVIFALFHFNPIALIPLIVLGIYFGYMVNISQSIFIPIIAHITNNAFTTIKVYFEPELIKQSSTTISAATESELIMFAVMVISLILTFFLHNYFKSLYKI